MITFDRRLSDARQFEREAYCCLQRSIIDILHKQELTNEDESKVFISAQALTKSTEARDLSVFFRYEEFGGSGGTYYYFLALKRAEKPSYSHGLYFDTSEAGQISISRDLNEYGYRVIEARDRSLYKEYQFIGECAYIDSELLGLQLRNRS